MKSILVHLDASPRAAERLSLAQALARRSGAEATALYAVLPSLLAGPWPLGDAGATVAQLMADLDRSQRERARETFERLAAQGPLNWEELTEETLLWSLRERALYSDLLVLGQHCPDDLQTGALPRDLVSSLVCDSGKPALVVPFAGSFEAWPATVLVAWKPTPQAARAVSAALPWLQQARELHLAWRPEDGPGAPDALDPLAHWLRLHGVSAALERHRLAGDEVGEGLLTRAAETSAGLLVMGCYGHSRAREWVLGGATRTVLRSMTLPVLMVH